MAIKAESMYRTKTDKKVSDLIHGIENNGVPAGIAVKKEPLFGLLIIEASGSSVIIEPDKNSMRITAEPAEKFTLESKEFYEGTKRINQFLADNGIEDAFNEIIEQGEQFERDREDDKVYQAEDMKNDVPYEGENAGTLALGELIDLSELSEVGLEKEDEDYGDR